MKFTYDSYVAMLKSLQKCGYAFSLYNNWQNSSRCVILRHDMEYRDNSGYFYEYDCQNILDLVPICNDKRCQTIGYIGEKDMFMPLIQLGIKGVDRIVPIGKTMDFDLIWDGYNLPEFLSRTIVVS